MKKIIRSAVVLLTLVAITMMTTAFIEASEASETAVSLTQAKSSETAVSLTAEESSETAAALTAEESPAAPTQEESPETDAMLTAEESSETAAMLTAEESSETTAEDSTEPSTEDEAEPPAAPTLSSAGVVKGGIEVKWKSVSGASGYRVYRKTPGGKWSRLADTTSTSYTDTKASAGNTYIYTVRAIDSDGTLSSYDAEGLTIKYLKTPALGSAAPASGGIKVTWSAVSGASKYRVYRKTSGGSWSKIAETTGTSYTDKSSLKNNTTYIYTVRALNENGWLESYYDTSGVKLKYMSTPALSKAEAVSTGVKVSWSKVSGTKKYRVYRKTSGGSWSKLAETTSTSYTDKTAKTNTTYIYTVRSINSDGVLGSWYDSTGVSLKYLKTPALSSAVPSSGGVKITWSKVSGASGYRVYRKTSGGSWARIVNSTTGTSYTDTTAKNNTTYYYTVRALDSNGAVSSYYNTSGVKLKYMSTPALSKAEAVSTGVKVSWSKVSGTKKYRVYRKTSGGSWSKLAETTSTSYTDKTAKTNTTYIYTVRSINSDGVLGSWYDSAGVSLKYLKTPALSSAAPAKDGVKITWSAVSGASKYRVYRKTSGGSWARIVDSTTGTSYTDTTAKTNTTYYYTVRALDSGGVVSSYYDTSGVKLKYLATPSLSSISNSASGIKVSWSSVSGASKYRVYRKTSGGSWSKLTETTSTSYTDTSAKSGTTYIYTVRAINSSGVLGSYYDTSGLSLIRLSNPTLKSAKYSSSKIKVTWSAVTGASEYNVYRKTLTEGWKKIGTSTSTSYTDSEGEMREVYYYTVRAVNGGTLSSYDSSGISAVFGDGSMGVDVSSWDGKIDWAKAKADGVEFAIIRIGWGSDYSDGSQDDEYAEYNMTQCEKYGIPYGIYIYSYALNTSEAKSEAAHVIRMIKNHNPTLGIWYDVEETDYYHKYNFYPDTKSADAADLLSFCKIFISQIKAAGYDRVGVYSYKSYFENILSYSAVADVGYIWYAYWGVDKPDKECNIWQYSSTGSVDGISGNVDMDIMYGFD